MIPNVNLPVLLDILNQLERRGVTYQLGAKADERNSYNPRSNGHLSTPLDTLDELDCSGFIRYAFYRAADLTLPDGSQNQREWFEGSGLAAITDYKVLNQDDPDEGCLFIAFIKPNTNGCGEIGHVWLVYKAVGSVPAVTMESHGGTGVDSRPWNSLPLYDEFYEAFQLDFD